MCADTLGGGRWPALRFDPISLVLAQRNGVEPPKKSAFLPRRLHHSRERYKSVDYTFLARLGAGAGGYLSPYLRRGRTGLVMAALRGRSCSRVSLSLSGYAYLQKRVSLGLHPVSLRKSKEMGWNGQGQRGLSPSKTAHTYKVQEKKGEPPARVPPWTPSCAFMSTGGVPPAAAGGQGRCPWTLPPLKRWTKLSNALRAQGIRV